MLSFVVMDKLEELYFIVTNNNCFEEAYKGRVCDILADLDYQQDTDLLLLALTVIQKLFHRLETVQICPYLRIIADGLVEKSALVDGLLKCLSHKKQHVVFSATKAIVVVLQMLSKQMIKIEWTDRLFNFSFGQETEQPWRKLYTMEILRKVFKNSKDTQKNEYANYQQVKNRACSCQHEEDAVYATISGSELAELCLGSFNLEHILFSYIPFVVRPNGVYSFMKSCQHIGTTEDFVVLQACLKLGDAIHDQENVKRDLISGIKENNLAAFLHCVMEIVKCLQRTLQKDTDVNSSAQPKCDLFKPLSTEHGIMMSESGELSSVKTHPEIEAEERAGQLRIQNTTAKQLCTIIATVTQYLHYPRLPSLIFKKILEVLDQVMDIQSFSLFSRKTDCANLEKVIRSSSIAFLSVVECCLLDKIPKCPGFVGFCGIEIKRSGSSCTSDSHGECTDVVALRKASLILVKSSLVVLKMASNQEGSSLFQKLSLSCVNLWCIHLLTVTCDIPAINNAVTKESSNQDEFHSLLISLFVDQDDNLVEVLLLLLLLFQEINRTVPRCEIPTNILDELNPHLLFAAFVESIEFDHSVLLDLLISSETRFLEYILQYLHFVVSDWKSFNRCLETYRGRSACSEKEATRKDSSNESLRELDSVSDFSNTELPEGDRRFHDDLNPEESESCYSQQEKQGEEEGVVWKKREVIVCDRSSSLIGLEGGSFVSCQRPENRCDMFCGRVSEAMRSSELCKQPDCDVLEKENQRSEMNGLKSIVLAYCSSDESDMEIEDGSENTTTPVHINNVDTNKSKPCPFSSDITDCFARDVDIAKTFQEQTTTVLSRDENVDYTAYECKHEHGEKQPAVFVTNIFDKIMTMLIRLRMSVTRLSCGGHFPYSATPLLALMETAEKCYDGC